MKIVILDGYALNPGDLSWKEIESLGDVTIYDRTASDEILVRSRGAEVLITNKTPFTAETLAQLPDLKYISVLATGYNVVDTEAARDRGIIVSNIPAYSTTSVAQMVFGLLLELCHRTAAHSDAVRSGRWSNHIDFCFWDYPLVELAGKTMGIIGLGQIGAETARIASAFRMKVISAGPRPKTAPEGVTDFQWVDEETLFAESDVISLNCPLFPETRHLINSRTLGLMKPSALLINASRGGLIDDEALAEALTEGRVAGAAMDVLSDREPPLGDNPLLSAPNCFITPHIAWATKEARTRLLTTATENLKAYIAGQPTNIVNR